ncbi:MAG: arginine N-succinyltransferase [Myxococcota bacterium]
MFLLRPADPGDLEAVVELARYLDSPNLPAEEKFLQARLECSAESFSQPGSPGPEREYQFALVDESDRVVGTCVVLAKHGTPEMPHLYLRVRQEERHSESVGVSVKHVTLQLGASHDGPSELGALILHPNARGQPGQPAKLLSWGRLAFMARHPGAFEPTVLAEMRASIDAIGHSAFWDAFGRHFTGMSYAEADRRSATEKAFVLDLFPDTPFYAALLDENATRQLGQVHEEALPALRLLEKAGFRWIGEIDPFDGGPFVGAALSEIVPIRETAAGRLASDTPADDAATGIVSTEEGGAFRATVAPAEVAGDAIRISKEARKRLGLTAGEEVALTPLPPSGQRSEQRG